MSSEHTPLLGEKGARRNGDTTASLERLSREIRSCSGDEKAETAETAHFLLPDFPHHGHESRHHHHHHHHHHRLQDEEERTRRWSTGDRTLLQARRREGGETPPLPLISDSHSIVGYDDVIDGGPGYQRTLRFYDKDQPLQELRERLLADFDGEGRDSRASVTSKVLENEAAPPYVCLGFSFAVLAGLCFTSSNVMVKFVPELNSWQLLFIRCISQIVAMFPIIIYTKSNPFGSPDLATRWRIFAQGILGGILLLGIFMAVRSLPLGDATAIFFSSPAFTMLLSTILLKDHCGLFRIFIATTLLGGVVILSRPPALFPPPPPPSNVTNATTIGVHDAFEGAYEVVGVSAAVLVPILSAWIVIITRETKHIHYSVLVFWFGVGGLIVSMIGMFAIDRDVAFFEGWDAKEWILSFLVAFVGIVGSMLMTQALHWVTPSKVMVIRSFEVLAAYILQVTVFNVPMHWSDLGGSLLVLVAVLSMGLEDWVMRRFQSRFV